MTVGVPPAPARRTGRGGSARRRARQALGRAARSSVVRTDAASAAVLVLLVWVPRPGRVAFDTKLDLLVDPGGFLARSLSVWNPASGLGELQNQAYGYLFPMGPFFLLGDALGLPPVVVQRAWQSLVLVLAYLGARRVVSRLGLRLPSAWFGAVAYALAPRVLTTLGGLSAEALGVALLPWILLPLLSSERLGPRRAAAGSACGVLAIGGANGAVTLAVLVVPVLWLLTRAPGPGRARLRLWWAGCTAAACAWWFVPLVVLGRYSPPFLDQIETAENTSGSITAFDALRGTTHWVAGFSRPDRPWWPVGLDLQSEPVLVLTTTVVAALGLAGLCTRAVPERRFLVLTASAGLLLLALGATAAGATPLAEGWRWLLDGPLVPFRNIHKFDPVLRLPLAVGAACAVQGLMQRQRTWARQGRVRSLLPAVATLAAVLAVLASTVPVAAGRLRAEPSWVELPSWWTEVADHLAAQQAAGGRDGTGTEPSALLVPSSGFAEYTWGRTVDEPLQPLAGSPWVVRKQFSLGAVGASRVLDAVEQALAAGRPAPGLAQVLARSGIDRLVVRNDLDWAATGSPRPAVVHATLDSTPGLRRTQTFGPLVRSAPDVAGVVGFDLDPAYPAVEVYEVEPAAARVRALPLVQVPVLSGGPESLLPAVAAGVVDPDRPVVLAGDDPVPGLGRWVLADGLRKRERDFGRIRENLSVTAREDSPQRVRRRTVDLLPFDPAGHQTVAAPRGIVSVDATSSAAFADSLEPVRTEYAPAAALDGDVFTSWRSSQSGPPVDEALRIELVRPTDLDGTTVVMENNPLLGPRITRLEVVTDAGSAFTDVPPSGLVELELADGATRTLTLRVDEADPGDGRVGVAEVDLPGVTASAASLRLPDDVPASLPRADSGTAAVVLSDDQPPRRACVPTGERAGLVRCDPGLARGSEDQAGMDRVFDLGRGDRYTLSGVALPGSGTALSRYLGSLGPALTAAASSVLDDQVAVRAGAAVDGDPGTAWVSAPGDAAPTIELSWPSERTVSALTVVPSTQPLAARPQRLELSTPTRTWQVDLDLGATVRFTPVTTDRLTVRLLTWERLRSLDPVSGLRVDVPPGVAELELDGGVDAFTFEPDPATRIGTLCGTGPTLQVDGRQVATTVDATLADLMDGREVRWTPCDTAELVLTAGRHTVRVEPGTEWDVTRVVLERPVDRPTGRDEAAGAEERTVEVRSWASSSRRLAVGPGPASLLVVPEGTNVGWQARLDGGLLRPQTVDGWQQGWVLPAGEGGDVELEFVPQRAHVAGLVTGAALALVVVLLALVRAGPAARAHVGPDRPSHLRALPAGAPGTGGWQRLAWTVGGLVPVLLGGPLGLGAVLAGVVLARWALARTVVVSGLCLAAGALVALDQAGGGGAPDTSAAVQVLVLTAFATTWWTARRPGVSP